MITSLPNEIISLIADTLDDIDLLSFHSTSARLRLGSDAIFRKRICREISVEVSLSSLRKWNRLLPAGELHPEVEIVYINPAHVPEIVDEPWCRWFADDYHGKPSDDRRMNDFRLWQSQPEYIDALEEQRQLLESGRFVSDMLAILHRLPNATRFLVRTPPQAMRWGSAKFIKALLDCKSSAERALTAAEFLKAPFRTDGDDRCALAALEFDYSPMQFIDEYFHHNRGGTQSQMSRKSIWTAWSDGLQLSKVLDREDYPRCQIGLVDARFRSSYLAFPGSRKFFRKLVTATLRIMNKLTCRTEKLSLSIGWFNSSDDSVLPIDLPSTGQIAANSGAPCGIESLELSILWPSWWTTPDFDIIPDRRYIDSFLQNFPRITELTIRHDMDMIHIHAVANIIRIETLKKISLWRIYCKQHELIQLIQPGQWQNLEELCLIDLRFEDPTERPGEDEVSDREAWTLFLQKLEGLSRLVSFRLVKPVRTPNLTALIDSSPHIVRQTWKRHVTRSWEGRLAAIAEML